MCNPMKHNDNKTLLYLACSHIGLIPNNSVLASISFVALCICWLFRFRANWENIKPLHKVPLLLSLYLFVAYECTSLFWSNEFTIGIENVISMRHCFLPVLLWPVMNQWKKIVWSIVFGVLFLNLSQSVETVEWILKGKPIQSMRTSGYFGGHPPTAGLWSAISSICIVYLFINAKGRIRYFLVTAFALSLLGVILSSGRANLVGLSLATGVAIVIFFCKGVNFKKLFCYAASIALTFLLILQIPYVGTFFNYRINQVKANYEDFVEKGDPTSSVGVRLVWWESSIRAFNAQPLFGIGQGSMPVWLSKDDALKKYRRINQKWYRNVKSASHIHNTYLSILAEGGLVGILLLLSTISLLIKSVIPKNFDSSQSILIASIFILWLTAGIFDSFLYHSQTFSVFAILITFALYNISGEPSITTKKF